MGSGQATESSQQGLHGRSPGGAIWRKGGGPCPGEPLDRETDNGRLSPSCLSSWWHPVLGEKRVTETASLGSVMYTQQTHMLSSSGPCWGRQTDLSGLCPHQSPVTSPASSWPLLFLLGGTEGTALWLCLSPLTHPYYASPTPRSTPCYGSSSWVGERGRGETFSSYKQRNWRVRVGDRNSGIGPRLGRSPSEPH